jgi:hypothetical protein
MTHEELKVKINKLSIEKILKLNCFNIKTLTDDYKEELIRKIIAKGRDCEQQLRIDNFLKQCHGEIYGFINYPHYFDDIELFLHLEEPIRDPDSQGIGSWDDFNVREPIGSFDDDFDETDCLNARIEELEAENVALRQQLEEHQSEEPAEEIEWHDKVRLELLLRLFENSGTNLKDVKKVRVAEVMQSVTGLPPSTCKNYCSNRDLNTKVHEEEILKLNSKLQAIGIDIRL